MSGIFLSYSRADHDLAERIIRGLRTLGVEVWWDEDMRGVEWQEELERQVSELGGVMVLWTPNSTNSKHVRDEARLALETDKLFNVLCGVPKPPFPFDRINGLPVDGWSGREPHRGWTRVIQTVEERLVQLGAVKAGAITGALAARDADYEARRSKVDAALEAFQEAQARESDAETAAADAARALETAEDQFQRVVELRPAAGVLKAAQDELEAARAARVAADAAHRDARSGLSERSRDLARARAAFEALDLDAGMRPPPPPPPPGPRPIAADATAKPGETARREEGAARADPSPRPAPTPNWPVIGVLAGVAVVALGLGVFEMSKTPARGTAGGSGGSGGGSVSGAKPAAAVLTADEQALIGEWAPSGLGCDSPVRVTVKDGVITLISGGTESAARISASGGGGVVVASGQDGTYTYRLGADRTLSVAGPTGAPTEMTRCGS